MATLADSVNYCDSVSYAAVGTWAAGAAKNAGDLIRQTAPTLGNERIFVCIVAGTTHATTEPTWGVTRGAKTTDNTVTWQECTGVAAVCGDATNTWTWAQLKALTTPTLGAIIKRNNGASYQICSTAGTMAGSEPAFSDTAGVTTADGTSTWTSLGVVGNWTAFKAAHGRLQNAVANTWFPTLSASPTGNGITYVGDDHAETHTASLTIAWGTNNLALGMAKVLCVDHTKVPPYSSGDLKTTATITTTGNAGITYGSSNESVYTYGITFSSGSGANLVTLNFNTNLGNFILDNCVLKAPATTGATTKIGISNGNARIILNNTSMYFGATGDGMFVDAGEFIWKNSTILAAGSAVPTNFLSIGTTTQYASILFEGCDLSGLTGNLNSQQLSANPQHSWIVKDCKLNSAMTVVLGTNPDMQLQFINCDSGATNYKSTRYATEGYEDTSTTYTRSAGAVDPGGQAQARRIAPAARMSQWVRPFNCEPFSIYNKTTGANVTLTVYGAWFGGCLPKNDEIWIDVEYLGTASFPQGVFATTTKTNILAANADVTTDSSTWTNSTLVTIDGFPQLGATVSGGNLVVTHNNTTNGAGCTCSFAVDPVNSTKKLYFEATITTSTSNGTSLGLAAGALADLGGGSYDEGTGVNLGPVNSQIFTNGALNVANLGATSVGDVYCFAIDFGNKLVWIRRNNGNWNADASANPATGTNGLTLAQYGFYAPAVRFTNAGATDAITFNFGATSYAQTKPSGFSDWGSAFQAFKLVVQLDTTHNPQPQFAGPIYVRPRAANRQAAATVFTAGISGQPAGGFATGGVGPVYYIDPRIELS